MRVSTGHAADDQARSQRWRAGACRDAPANSAGAGRVRKSKRPAGCRKRGLRSRLAGRNGAGSTQLSVEVHHLLIVCVQDGIGDGRGGISSAHIAFDRGWLFGAVLGHDGCAEFEG